jgi:hypothetical protein
LDSQADAGKMTAFEKALKKSTKRDLLAVIRAALDCPSHFEKPKIVQKDKFFRLGDKAIVICDQCVERMHKSLGLEPDESLPTAFHYDPVGYWKAEEKMVKASRLKAK